MSAETIAKAFGGRKTGSGWSARCPAHDDRTPSLSLRDSGDGKVLVHCHAGCTQGSVITVLKQRGLWPNGVSTASDLKLINTPMKLSNSNSDVLRRKRRGIRRGPGPDR